MKRWIKYNGVGSDSLIPVDGRWSISSIHKHAIEMNKRAYRNYDSFEILQGERLLTAKVIFAASFKKVKEK
jgi:hypothetical protein